MQRYPIQPKDFCRQRHWLPPKELSLKAPLSDPLDDTLLQDLLQVAMHP
jgi:hypothetical protein